MTLTVLYRDDALLAVDKPSGMLVHRGWGRDPVVLVDLVKELLQTDVAYPMHRIDRQTSGVVLFALSAPIASSLGSEFEDGSVKKQYLALVRGVAPESGCIDHPIPRKVDGPRVDAITDFKLLKYAQTEPRHVSWVEARPKTGRLHQIRRHLKHISHPVIGDSKYGKGQINRAMAEKYGLKRMALHAEVLSLIHPVSGDVIEIKAPIPEDLSTPLERMGILD